MTLPQYVEQDKRRDPERLRRDWIVSMLMVRPRSSSELKDLSESNGLGFAKATYSRDLTAIEQANIVYRERGRYHLNPTIGMQYAVAKGIHAA